jgi:hypothetical protein
MTVPAGVSKCHHDATAIMQKCFSKCIMHNPMCGLPRIFI